MEKIATIRHSDDFESDWFSVVGNANSLVSSYNFVNRRVEGHWTALDIEPVIDFKYNTLPTAGLIRNIPYTCLYKGGNAGYPDILGKQKTFNITTTINNDKVFHKPGDPLFYSTQASGFTSPFFCVAIDENFFSSSSELYPILLYAPVGKWLNNSGLPVWSYICLIDAYVGSNLMNESGILPSDNFTNAQMRKIKKEDRVRYAEQISAGDEPQSMFADTRAKPEWVDSGGLSSIWHFNPKMIDNSIMDKSGAYYSYSKYLVGDLPNITSNHNVEALTLTYHILDFEFDHHPATSFDISDADFYPTNKTYEIKQNEYYDGPEGELYRSSRSKFYARYIQYRV